jgi:hypothetical protein
MGWLFLAAVVAGCTDRPGSSDNNDDSTPIDDNTLRDDTGDSTSPPLPLQSATSWVECNWASVPASPISSVAVGGKGGAWFGSASQVYTLDVPTHTLIKDLDSPSGTRAMWADADDNVYTISNKAIAMRLDGGAWTPLREEKDRSLVGLSGNDFGVWFATSDGTVLHYDNGKWTEESDGPDGFTRAIYGANGSLWAATASTIYYRDPEGAWSTEYPPEGEKAEQDVVFEEIRGDASSGGVWASYGETGGVLHRDRFGIWSDESITGAVGTVHLWSQAEIWYASDGISTWQFGGDSWFAVTGPEQQFAPTSVVSNGSLAYALGGGDAIARSDTAGEWDLAIASPWAPVYDAMVVGDNMFAAGEAGLYPDQAGLVRYISDGFWVPELQGATIRALLSADDLQLWAAGTGGIWHMNGEWNWTADLTDAHDFTALAAGADGAVLAVASDGTFFERQHADAWTPEKTGATSLSAVVAYDDQIWVVGDGIFRRDAAGTWFDESPGNGTTFSDIERAVDLNGNDLGLWAVGQLNGLPAVYSRSAEGEWTVEPNAPKFPDATSGVIARMSVDTANSIWLFGEQVTAKNGAQSFLMHSDSTGWVGEAPGSAGVARRMIWMSDRRWVFGDTIDVRPRTVEGCI